MEYNTGKEKLVIREYGRNVQNLVNYAMTVEDRERRNKIARYIIELMAQISPQYKNVEEYRRKLWDHLFYISDFKLDVDSPYPKPDPEDLIKTFRNNGRMPYPPLTKRNRHYGRNIETMIKRAIDMEDEKKRTAYTKIIANYMKLAYANWTRENVTDDIILNDIQKMSGGVLKLQGEDMELASVTASVRNKRKSQSQNYRGKSNNRNKNYRKRGQQRR